MFKLKQSQTYFWPVTVKSAIDGGAYEKQTFDAEFRRLPQSEVESLQELTRNSQSADRDIARKVLVGWKGIGDDNGEPLPFSQTKLDELLDMPSAAAMIVIAYYQSIGGLLEKN